MRFIWAIVAGYAIGLLLAAFLPPFWQALTLSLWGALGVAAYIVQRERR